jgi:sialidase-1
MFPRSALLDTDPPALRLAESWTRRSLVSGSLAALSVGVGKSSAARTTETLNSPDGGKLPPIPGRTWHQLRRGLERAFSTFETGGNARVAFLGGSITASSGWRDLVMEDLKRRFPKTTFEFIAAGIPSLGSTPHAFRLERDVLGKGPLDLLFVEAAVNDSTNGFPAVEQVRGMEGLVRHVRRARAETDVVLLHFADPEKLADYRGGRTPEVIESHERVAERYGAPSIDLAREVHDRIDAGQFSWDRDFKDLHPAPFGHQLYAASVRRLFDEAKSRVRPGTPVRGHELPAPLDADCYDRGRLVAPSAATGLTGFDLAASWRPTEGDRSGTRPGFVQVPMLVADQPGGKLSLEFEGTAIGLFVISGPDVGQVRWSVDGGPAAVVDLMTRWSNALHLPWAKMLAAGLTPGKHRLELVTEKSPTNPKPRSAVRIVHFLVNG